MTPADPSPKVGQTVEDTIRLLVSLQALDDQLSLLSEERKVGPASLEEKERELERARREAEDKHHAVQQAQKEGDGKELEVAACEEHIRKLEVQRGAVRKNDEYKGLTGSITAERERCSRLEEAALASWAEVDEYRTEQKDRQELARRIEQELQTLRAKVEAETQRIDREIARISQQRAAVVAETDPGALGKYERIRNGRAGKAIVPVVNGVCQGCYMGVTDQTVNRLILRKELVYCENCSRILYLPEDSISALIRGPQQE